MGEGTNLESSLRENRVFAPPAEFVAKAHVQGLEQYEAMYRRSVEDPEGFWGEAAGELEWFAPWTKVLVGEASSAQWFVDGKLTLSHNCVDRHALGARREELLRLMLFDGMRPAVFGLGFGLIASAAATRLIESMLYGTRPLDPAVFGGVVAALLVVAVLACLIPAWRASRLDPMQALRAE